MLLKGFLILTAVSLGVHAHAACYHEDLTGYWDYYDGGNGSAGRCSLRVNARGEISLHSRGCMANGESLQPPTVSGQLAMGPFCNVTGTVTVEGETGTLDGTLNRSRDLIHGVVTTPQDGGDEFTMVKFW